MNPIQAILILMVRIYRVTLCPAKSFLFGPFAHCRFTPSCSKYALEAIKTHGAMRGSGLAAKRICRCHPWGECGHDPVPPEINQKRSAQAGLNSSLPTVSTGISR